MRKLKKSELKRVYGAGHAEDTNLGDSLNECDSDAHLGGTLDSDKHVLGGEEACDAAH